MFPDDAVQGGGFRAAPSIGLSMGAGPWPGVSVWTTGPSDGWCRPLRPPATPDVESTEAVCLDVKDGRWLGPYPGRSPPRPAPYPSPFTHSSNHPIKRAHMSNLFSIARGVCDSYGYS